MKLVLGSMELGRRLSQDSLLSMCKALKEMGHIEIDTASLYADGATEFLLGNMMSDLNSLGMKISTKVYPSWKDCGFEPNNLKEQFLSSLQKLKLNKVDILYLHWPSKVDSLEDTVRAIDDLHKQGLFDRFGVSNYAAWEVMLIHKICEKKSFIKPVVYQGMYNMFTRKVEEELIPCLRSLGMSFYAYNPLAGGILTGRYSFDDLSKFTDETTPNRFHGSSASWSKAYQDRFWKNGYFDALTGLKEIIGLDEYKSDVNKGSEKLISSSFSWVHNHSALKNEFGDALIIGSSSYEQFMQNIDCFKSENELPSAVLEKINKLYCKHIDGCCPKYFR